MTPAEVGKGRGREQCWGKGPSRDGSEFDQRGDLVGCFLILLRQDMRVEVDRCPQGTGTEYALTPVLLLRHLDTELGRPHAMDPAGGIGDQDREGECARGGRFAAHLARAGVQGQAERE